jgi:hypothetical protein
MSASLVGLLVALIIRPPSRYFKFTIVHIAIGKSLPPLRKKYQQFSTDWWFDVPVGLNF